jgi:hypothetical protein
MNAKKEGLERIVKGVAKVVDDWGWKGGKPGELTGGEYQKRLDDLYQLYKRGGRGFYNPWRKEEDLLRDKMDTIIDDQVAKSKNFNLKKIVYQTGIEKFTKDMQTLENADIPREWTGKVWPVIQKQLENKYDYVPPILAQQVSDLMRPMTDDQRYMFLKLMSSNISGQTLDRIASTVRRITKS